MHRLFYCSFLILTLFSCSKKLRHSISAEEKKQLIKDLTEIGELDQKYRNKATELRAVNKGIRTEEEGELWAKQSLLDSINIIRMEKIIASYGYPGADIVGNDLKSVALLVIAHAPKKQEFILSFWARSPEMQILWRG